jgi:beta-N-acetylhexosaminidase
MAAGEFGNVIFFERNLVDEDQTRVFIRQLQDDAVVRTGVPMLTAVDQEGGRVNRLGPLTGFKFMRHGARTLGDLYSYAPQKARQVVNRLTADVAHAMRSLGFNMNLAPVLDLTDDQASYIYDRSYGGDPSRVSRIAADYAAIMRQNRVVATGKHFPNLSLTRTDSHQALPRLDRSLAQLESYEFVPFRSLKDQLGAVMVGHVMVPELDPKLPTSISPAAMKALRERVGFRGVVISDDLKMKALSSRFPFYEIVLRSVFADVDILLIAWDKDKQLEAVDVLERAVAKGKLPVARIDRSVRRILSLKYRFAR